MDKPGPNRRGGKAKPAAPGKERTPEPRGEGTPDSRGERTQAPGKGRNQKPRGEGTPAPRREKLEGGGRTLSEDMRRGTPDLPGNEKPEQKSLTSTEFYGRGRAAGEGKGRPGAGKGRAAGEGKGRAAGEGKGRAAGEGKGRAAGEGKGRAAGEGKGRPGAGKDKTLRDGDPIRLNKYIANSGICSRREADKLIAAGLVSVNGKIITEMGSKVNPGDDVRYNGERMKNERKVYILLNKPKDFVTTTDDPKERRTVMQLIANACSERVYPVGRLDRNTTGVLLFTNDGEMAKKLTHPGHNKKKIYHVFLDKSMTAADLKKLSDGITLEDGFIQPDAIDYASSENKKEIGLEIHSGRNRIVRRMFESMGYRVNKLDRVYFAGLTKKNLARGRWRFLTEKEINQIKMNAYE